MKLKRIFFLLLFLPLFSFSQTANIKGVLADENKAPLAGTKIVLTELSIATVTDSMGNFSFSNVPYGTYSIETNEDLFDYVLANVKVEQSEVDLSASSFSKKIKSANDAENIPTVSYSDDDLKSSEGGGVASVLSASRDAFASAASFSFSVARFRIRGYDDENSVTLMNGVQMTDLATGRNMYGTWSGLNDMMRSREATFGLAPSYYSFGGVGGAFSIDSRASHQRKQMQVSYAISNRTYDNRVVFDYGSGLLKGGWAYAVSYTRRWADEGFVEGTFYDGHSYFASVEKFIGTQHSLSFTAFGAPTKNGRSSSAVQEMYDLARTHYYNSNWGYQEGKKRNAVVGNNHQPVIILNHDFKINEKSSLESAVAYAFGKNKLSGLDWYNATDPRPDYYRKLPSFDPYYGDDPIAYAQFASEATALFQNDENVRQINWDALYEANALHDTTYNGTSGTLAKYVLNNRVTDNKKIFFNTFYNNVVNDHLKLTGGLSVRQQSTEYYKEINDLLGADFFVDLDQFAELGNPIANQNDLNNPNRVLHKGDKYGYDYTANISNYGVWGQSLFNYNRFDYMFAVNLSGTSMYRDGKFKNGTFSETSFGKSKTVSFSNFGVKGGATYKYNGRNYLFANASLASRAPAFENIFLSPRTRNEIVSKPESEKITSLEGGYILKAPRVKGKLVGYLTEFTDITDTKSFYHDDYHTFVNYTITGINKRHAGIEASIDASLGEGFTASGVVAIGQYVYTSRPLATITQDNEDTVLAENETVYWKNIRIAGTPQRAYTFGMNYRSPKFWFLSCSFNFFDGIYYDANPSRRTISSLDLVEAQSTTWNNILKQKKSPTQYTADVSGGWSWKVNNKYKALKKNTFLVFNIGITNLLDNQDIVTNAYEQLRFDSQEHNVDKFPAKVGYAFGRTYFASVILRMN